MTIHLQPNVLVLPIKTFMIILGMHQFSTLGESYMNCATLIMRFKHKGHDVILQGEQLGATFCGVTKSSNWYKALCITCIAKFNFA